MFGLCKKSQKDDSAELSAQPAQEAKAPPTELPLCVVIFGATGDLARKKLYPALYQLMFGCPDAPRLPRESRIVGYGRGQQELSSFLEKQCVNVKGAEREAFLKQCSYFEGTYEDAESFERLDKHLQELVGNGQANRLFFFSVPPTVFGPIVQHVKAKACATGGFTRLLIEKPFGRDSGSFAELNAVTSAAFREDELFRIDHYLGKEVVLNLVALRFGNQFFETLWNSENIAHVQLVFKEDLGTGGRGGYFDNFGIIRDIMQNHLMQVFLWLAMEPPASLKRTEIAQQKCKLLKATRTVVMEDCFLGQFGPSEFEIRGTKHRESGYLEDKTVPAGSKCPTFAAAVLHVDNERWKGVPFMMMAGKGLDERMAEVRVTFKPKEYNALVPGAPNELVMRIQPDEAIYLKILNKVPGWDQAQASPAVLDMSYARAFPGSYVADGYERMFLNAFRGDGSLFVGSDELTEAWRLFTPLLDEIDSKKPDPVIYPFGVRVPKGMDEFAQKYGITMNESWEEHLALYSSQLHSLKNVFDSLDKDKDGRLDAAELKLLAQKFYDGREPSDAQVSRILNRLDKNGDGTLDFGEVQRGVEAIARCSLQQPK